MPVTGFCTTANFGSFGGKINKNRHRPCPGVFSGPNFQLEHFSRQEIIKRGQLEPNWFKALPFPKISHNMKESMRFYEALPKHKAELVDGQMYIAGSLAKSAMALGYMVEKLGAAYVAELVPKDLLRDAAC